MKRKNQILSLAVAAILLSGCNAQKDVVYVQELGNNQYVKLTEPTLLRMQPGDHLQVMVYCDNAIIASAFNLSSASGGASGASTAGSTKEDECYTVDKNGNIKMPTLGDVHVQGKTREEIAEEVQRLLVEKQLLRNPVVTVTVKDMFITVLGDVDEAKRIPYTKDEMTLTEVLSECGDLNINGVRVIKVMRPEGGKMICYTVDLKSAVSLYSSPVYYLHPKDVIYVSPNKTESNQTRVNANNLNNISFWMSVGTFITTLMVLVSK